MATTTFQVTADANRALTTDNRPLAPGRLSGVTADIQSTGSNPAQNYIRVFIEGQNVGQANYRHIILQGYIGFVAALSWSGNFPLGNDIQITAEILSSTTATLVISVTTEPN